MMAFFDSWLRAHGWNNREPWRNGFANSFVERVEGIPRMDNRTKAIIFAYDDRAIQSVVNAITGLEHRTPAW